MLSGICVTCVAQIWSTIYPYTHDKSCARARVVITTLVFIFVYRFIEVVLCCFFLHMHDLVLPAFWWHLALHANRESTWRQTRCWWWRRQTRARDYIRSTYIFPSHAIVVPCDLFGNLVEPLFVRVCGCQHGLNGVLANMGDKTEPKMQFL